jgi:integrase
LLRLARKRRYITEVPEFDMAREPEGRLRFLSEDEAAKLLAACEEASSDRRMISQRSPYLFAIVTIALNTGMRKGEILGLTGECVDFARGVILLQRTKSGRRREVPMNRAVDRVLADLREKQARASDDGAPLSPAFRRADGSAWGSIRKAFEGACEAAKVSDFRFHDLRHTCASWLVMRGRPLKEVQELLGHASITMTMRYAHLAPDRLRDAVASLEDFSTRSAQEATKTALQPVTTCQN